jgi:hypothetical protein
MAQTVCVLPPTEDRQRLLAIVADRNRPLKHVQRAHIVLCSADRLPVNHRPGEFGRLKRKGRGKPERASILSSHRYYRIGTAN